MKLTPLKPLVLEARDGSLELMGKNRPHDFPHLGTIIHAMKENAGEKVTGIEGEDPNLRALFGFLWERSQEAVFHGVPHGLALEAAWKEYLKVANLIPDDRSESHLIETQFSLLFDGLRMTPDEFDAPFSRLGSAKATWRSMRKWVETDNSLLDNQHHDEILFTASEGFWPWFTAEKGYLWALSAREGRLIDTCRFYILWVNGDYSRQQGHGPQASYSDVTWTEAELETNWRSIQRYRKSMFP